MITPLRPPPPVFEKKTKFKYFVVIWSLFGTLKKKISKNEQNCRNFCKKMKFKTRLVAGNGILPAKIWHKGPVSPLELSCKIFRPHLKNS